MLYVFRLCLISYTLTKHISQVIIHMENTLSKMCNLSNEKKKMDKARQATASLIQITEVTNEGQRCPQSYYM